MMSAVYRRNKQCYKFVKKHNSFVGNKQYPSNPDYVPPTKLSLSNLFYPSAISITPQQITPQLFQLNYPSPMSITLQKSPTISNLPTCCIWHQLESCVETHQEEEECYTCGQRILTYNLVALFMQTDALSKGNVLKSGCK